MRLWGRSAAAWLFLLVLPLPLVAVTTYGPSDSYIVTNPAFAGIAILSSGCTAELIGDYYMLTAGHCAHGTLEVTFSLASGSPSYSVAAAYVNPGYAGSGSESGDIALLVLSTAAAPYIPRYSLYTGTDELDQTITIAGYGYSGQGQETTGFGILHAGLNQVDAFWDGVSTTNPVNGQQYTLDDYGSALAYDFDGGATNLLGGSGLIGASYVAPHNEAFNCYGDSGGPSFSGDVLSSGSSSGMSIIGVHVFISDIDPKKTPDCSFGEIAGDTRVSAYVPWIDATITSIPEPLSAILVASGLAGMLLRRRARRRAGGLK